MYVLDNTRPAVGKLRSTDEIWCVAQFSLACNCNIIVTSYPFNKFLLSYTLYCDSNIVEKYTEVQVHIFTTSIWYIYTQIARELYGLFIFNTSWSMKNTECLRTTNLPRWRWSVPAQCWDARAQWRSFTSETLVPTDKMYQRAGVLCPAEQLILATV